MSFLSSSTTKTPEKTITQKLAEFEGIEVNKLVLETLTLEDRFFGKIGGDEIIAFYVFSNLRKASSTYTIKINDKTYSPDTLKNRKSLITTTGGRQTTNLFKLVGPTAAKIIKRNVTLSIKVINAYSPIKIAELEGIGKQVFEQLGNDADKTTLAIETLSISDMTSYTAETMGILRLNLILLLSSSKLGIFDQNPGYRKYLLDHLLLGSIVRTQSGRDDVIKLMYPLTFSDSSLRAAAINYVENRCLAYGIHTGKEALPLKAGRPATDETAVYLINLKENWKAGKFGTDFVELGDDVLKTYKRS